MAEVVRGYQTRITAWFSGLERRRQLIYIGSALAVIVLIALVVVMFNRTNYVTLSRGLTPAKSGEITAKLDELGIAWRSEDNATTILVDDAQIDTARMQLSLSGITSEDVFTFEDVMDRLTFTQTTEEKNRLFLYNTVSEIESALRSLEDIEDATVIAYVKESSSFLNLEDDLSSASVRLVLADGKNLSADSIKGIESFILTSIRGLTAEKITIIDQTGARLNAYNANGEIANSSSQDELKVSIEQRLDNSIRSFLAPIYGLDNITVKSSVALDFDAETTQIIQFSPPLEGTTDGLIRSSNVLKENVSGGTTGGVAGTDSNTTDVAEYPTLESAESDYTKTQETFNYELNEIQKTIVKAEGQISDVSIAVLLNTDVLEDNQLTDEHRQELTQLLTAAAGVSDTSVVRIMAKSFYVEPEVPVTATAATFFGVPMWVLALLLGVIAVLGIAAFIMMRRRSESLQVAQEIIEEQEELEEINTEFQDKSSPKYQIEKFIESKPEAVAQLLRSWLNED